MVGDGTVDAPGCCWGHDQGQVCLTSIWERSIFPGSHCTSTHLPSALSLASPRCWTAQLLGTSALGKLFLLGDRPLRENHCNCDKVRAFSYDKELMREHRAVFRMNRLHELRNLKCFGSYGKSEAVEKVASYQ